MRQALASVIAIAAAVTALPALGQTTPPPAPAVEPAAPAPATAAQTPAAPAAVAATPATAEPAPAPVQLPPTPNDPMTLRVLQVLDTICEPLVQGQGDLESLTKPLRFKERRGAYTLKVDRNEVITLRSSGTNDNVCFVELEHQIGGDKPITIGLHNWAVGRGYKLYRNDEFTTDMKRHTRSWELNTDERQAALVFVTTWNPDGSSVERHSDRSTIMYTIQ